MDRSFEEYTAGLTTAEAEKRREKYGENVLKGKKKAGAGVIFFSQFKDVLVLILLASTVISVLMKEYVEALTIIAIVFLNATVGFIQEYRTEKTLEALKRLAAPTARTIRNGKVCEIEVKNIVPGDVILVEEGDKCPADAKIIETFGMAADESLLSGESVPVEKGISSNAEIGEIFMGTVITKGHGKAVVVRTGMSTKMGAIAGMLSDIEEGKTPLQEKLASMGKVISVGCLLICIAVTLIGIIRGEEIFNMFLTGLSLAVAVIPEGLPAVVTIALGLGVSRMLKKKALVRRLHAVETLGCSDVICSDKTGTLTENKMTVKEVYVGEDIINISASSKLTEGNFYINGEKINIRDRADFTLLSYIAVLCNNAKLLVEEKSGKTTGWKAVGDPTEAALTVMAANAGIFEQNAARYYRKIGEKPFDSERKMMSVEVKDERGNKYLFVKGAPEILLERCRYRYTVSGNIPLNIEEKKRLEAVNEEMSSKALRGLAFGYKKMRSAGDSAETELVFVGIAGMIDPPRKEAAAAVAKCKSAGIRPIMITGDSKNTALAIAKQLKICTSSGRAVTGAEIDAMNDTQFMDTVRKVSVFARVSPAHKLRIVKALKAQGHITAMTGDGVNDAPAIKEADIGVAMGKGGSDVTKEASGIILLDDNFATLVTSVEEGRIIYSNIRKFIRYLLSCNIGEALTMFLGMLMGMPAILLPIQILLVNLVTDSLPAIALGFEPGEKAVMRKKPRKKEEGIFSGGLLSTIIFRGCFIGISTLSAYVYFLRKFSDTRLAGTAALVTLIMAQLIHVFECKSEEKGLFGINPLTNLYLIGACAVSFGVMMVTLYIPAVSRIFEVSPLSAEQLFTAFLFALAAPVLTGIVRIISVKMRQKKWRQNEDTVYAAE